MDQYKYPGNELKLFEKATNWKRYVASQVKPYIKNNVLEVGAGIGAMCQSLNNGSAQRWLLLEPDNKMVEILKEKKDNHEFPSNTTISNVPIQHYTDVNGFDTILFMDVLEHIEFDKQIIEHIHNLLLPEGHLIILAPAHQYLYSAFDKEIGHYRRYNAKQLTNLVMPAFNKKRLRYIDSLGFFASGMNRLFLKKKYPTKGDVLFWDRLLIPISKIIDKITAHSFGKSIIGIWVKKSKV